MTQDEGSIRLTVIKTGATIGLTALLVFLLRWALSVLPRFDAMTGGHTGGDVLRFLASNGQAQAQQTVAVVMIVLCFVLAVLLVHGIERLLRRRRASR
ncbi:hypothetical protein [Acetobacter fabarum]|uniref:hypothetical protein n=1 Tax=Acetobacter fabarum TaxID=483199 RepID=UPI00209DE0E4|nr:hypothetical protein [Acetobacter fabarum]MCP1226913.1 hypothetical protein [Acetobacter fabarum]MCP1232427.1 hypothetical protein [Acetobacter fabarum]